MKTLPKIIASDGLRVFPQNSLYLFFIFFSLFLTFSEKPSDSQKREKKSIKIKGYSMMATLRRPSEHSAKPSALGGAL